MIPLMLLEKYGWQKFVQSGSPKVSVILVGLPEVLSFHHLALCYFHSIKDFFLFIVFNKESCRSVKAMRGSLS